MSYRTPGPRRTAVRKVADALRASRRAVLTTHLNADGDGAGSEVALAAWMRANGTHTDIVNPTPYPDLYRFLLPDPDWVLPASSAAARDACLDADLAVVLDTGEVPRIGRVKPMIEHLTTVVVDHHPPGGRPIGGISLRDSTACATGELVYDVLLATGGPWPAAAAVGLYVAILTDTGSFRFANATPASHRITASLIERGVDPQAMYNHVYGAVSMRHFRLLQAALATLETEDGVAWMSVPEGAFEEIEATADDLEGLVDYPRSIQGIEVALLFRRTSRGTKISFRSNGRVDVNALARKFGGGGHRKASGALVAAPPDEVLPAALDAARAAARGVTRSASEGNASVYGNGA